MNAVTQHLVLNIIVLYSIYELISRFLYYVALNITVAASFCGEIL